jgi:AcrR family transcriptional regulator
MFASSNNYREQCSQMVFYTIAMGSSTPGPRKPVAKIAQAAGDASAALPPPPRFRRRHQAPARRTSLSVEAIVAAAIEALDEGGVAGLSMRKVAERLDTGAASLYAYVSGKDELLELVFDELVGQVTLPEPDPATWREQLIKVLRDFHDVLVSHRDAALAGLGRIPTTPRALVAAEGIAGLMRAGGLSERVIALGLDQLILYVAAHAFERSMYEYGEMSSEELEQYFEEVHEFFSSLPAASFPVLASIADDIVGFDGEERLQFGLEALVAGLEALSAREQADLDRR